MILTPGGISLLTGLKDVSLGGSGVDFLVLTLPVRVNPDWEPSGWEGSKRTPDSFKAWTDAGLPGMRFQVMRGISGAMANVTAQPAKVMRAPNNVNVPEDLFVQRLANVAWMAIEVDLGIETLATAAGMAISRIDLTRNVALPAGVKAAEVLASLQALDPAYAKQTMLYRGRTGWETVQVGNGSRMVRIYDKHRKTPVREAEGILRWEAQVLRDHLRGRKLDHVSAATPTQLEALRDGMWRWSGMDTALINIGGPLRSLSDIAERGAATQATLNRLLGAYLREFEGLNERTRQRSLHDARDLGVLPAFDSVKRAIDASGTTTYRLDYVTGTFVEV